jgi:uncharacterized membrane protein (DUF373 family)
LFHLGDNGSKTDENGAAMPDHDDQSTGVRVLSTRAFQQVEHGLYVALAVLLCATILLALAGAAVTLWSGLGDWSGTNSVFVVIDRLLVVLMLVEILHTVHVSVRSGTLTCEPFLVVGLIASIRRVLVITLESSRVAQHGDMSDSSEKLFRASMIELGVLGVLILVMVVSIYLLRRAHEAVPDEGPPHSGPAKGQPDSA